jgi:hypothetical protein
LKYTDRRISGRNESMTYEEFLKLIKEFKNYVDTYNTWNAQTAAHTAYTNFCRCLAGAARDQWDLINAIEDDEVRDDITFQYHVRETVILGNNA